MENKLKYAFQELKQVLFQENCKEVVVLKIIKKFDVGLDEAEKIVQNAFDMWTDAYVE